MDGCGKPNRNERRGGRLPRQGRQHARHLRFQLALLAAADDYDDDRAAIRRSARRIARRARRRPIAKRSLVGRKGVRHVGAAQAAIAPGSRSDHPTLPARRRRPRRLLAVAALLRRVAGAQSRRSGRTERGRVTGPCLGTGSASGNRGKTSSSGTRWASSNRTFWVEANYGTSAKTPAHLEPGSIQANNPRRAGRSTTA